MKHAYSQREALPTTQILSPQISNIRFSKANSTPYKAEWFQSLANHSSFKPKSKTPILHKTKALPS